MIPALYILACAALNRLRGSDWGKPWTSKGVTSAVTGILTGGMALWLGYGLTQYVGIGLITWAGIWLWAAPGWGKYFSVLDGLNIVDGRDRRYEHEIGWIDRFDSIQNPSLRGFVQMSLRGVYLAPLLLALASLTHSAWCLVLAPLCLLQGAAYFSSRVFPKRIRVEAAECIWGLCIGVMLYASIYAGVL